MDKQKLLQAIIDIRDAQEEMTDEERTALWFNIMGGYCASCGSEHLPCYCEYDE